MVFFTYQAHQIYILARATHENLEQTPDLILKTRATIFENGYSIFDTGVGEEYYALITTLHEQKLLFKEWVQKVPSDAEKAYDYLFTQGRLSRVVAALDDQSKYAVLRDMIAFEEKYRPINVSEDRFSMTLHADIGDGYNKLHHAFKETFGSFNKESDHLQKLQIRFENYKSNSMAKIHQCSIAEVCLDMITKTLNIYDEYSLKVYSKLFDETFRAIFDPKDASEGYQAWLRREISKLPDDAQNKQFLLNCLPQETL